MTHETRCRALVAASPSPPSPSRRHPIKPELLSGLVWRNVGPFRGGRISAVSGVIGEPGTFYIGLPAGGVWKTTNAGATWWPIFDSVKDAEVVGALEVAPSNGNTIYVGTGDLITGGGMAEGNGMYKSTDAGATWTHIGLEKTKQIPSIVVDPRDANAVLVAAQGDVHTKNDSRGVYRSTDGGTNWTRTLFVDDSTGIQKLAIAFDRPDVVFATTVRHYTPAPSGPAHCSALDWVAAEAAVRRAHQGPTGTSIYKSWTAASPGKSSPAVGCRASRVARRSPSRTAPTRSASTSPPTSAFSVRTTAAPPGSRWTRPTRASAMDRAATTAACTSIRRIRTSSTSSTPSSYISRDGGNTFTGFRGAPGGDDPQQGWIDPTNGKRMILGYDQGAIVSLDGGATWSSWYNQSTEQVYHVSTDNSFPYWIYASQQDAGAIRTRAAATWAP